MEKLCVFAYTESPTPPSGYPEFLCVCVDENLGAELILREQSTEAGSRGASVSIHLTNEQFKDFALKCYAASTK